MEKNNIFEGAKFGEKFLTRGGRQAVYINDTSYITIGRMHNLVTEDFLEITVGDDGLLDYEEHTEQSDDIVSKYHEEIDEENLDKLANEFADRESIPFSRRSDIDSFKAGYRKAKEE